MAMYYTLGTNDGAPIDGAPRWSGREWGRDDFRAVADKAARAVDPAKGDIHVVLVSSKVASGRLG